MNAPMRNPPIVVVAVGVDDDALDACLAALEAGTPAGTRVWLADDAQSGPRGYAIIERWMARTALAADYTRRQRGVGEVAHLAEVLAACRDADIAVLAPDAVPTPGWLNRLAECFVADGAIATATPWSNAGEAAAWPRIGEIGPVPDDLERLARAAAAMPATAPELPAAVSHAVLLRGSALRRVGGLDAESYGSWYAALVDLSLRLSGLGWRNALCDTAFVARGGEGGPFEGDMDRLAVRWPDWHARLAHFLMRDPLRAARGQLASLVDSVGPAQPQRDLFGSVDASPVQDGPAAVAAVSTSAEIPELPAASPTAAIGTPAHGRDAAGTPALANGAVPDARNGAQPSGNASPSAGTGACADATPTPTSGTGACAEATPAAGTCASADAATTTGTGGRPVP